MDIIKYMTPKYMVFYEFAVINSGDLEKLYLTDKK